MLYRITPAGLVHLDSTEGVPGRRYRQRRERGGDFREAKIYNGIAVRKGWYIHPRTGERIEADF